MDNIRLTVFARSDVGRVRTNNEDAYLVSDLASGARLDTPAIDVDVRDRGLLAVVSDGMGGHAAGDVASALVVESLRKSLSDPAADHSSLQRLIDGAIRQANAEVREAARAADKRGMGATLTAVLFHDHDAFVAEVGDSRGYLLRNGRLRQITKDQSFVQMLIDAGVLTSEQAKDSPQKNVILQAIGREPGVRAAIGRLSLRRGDRLLLCCDGLSNLVKDAELAALLGDRDVSTICDRMIDLANERGGEDNLTAVVALVEGEGLPAPSMGEQAAQTVEVLQEYMEGTPGPRAAIPATPGTENTDVKLAPMPASAASQARPNERRSRQAWLVVVVVIGLVLAALVAWRWLS